MQDSDAILKVIQEESWAAEGKRLVLPTESESKEQMQWKGRAFPPLTKSVFSSVRKRSRTDYFCRIIFPNMPAALDER